MQSSKYNLQNVQRSVVARSGLHFKMCEHLKNRPSLPLQPSDFVLHPYTTSTHSVTFLEINSQILVQCQHVKNVKNVKHIKTVENAKRCKDAKDAIGAIDSKDAKKQSQLFHINFPVR